MNTRCSARPCRTTGSPAIRVGGGTAEIQRNILAEQVLGLPPDIRADKGMPFNKIPSGRD